MTVAYQQRGCAVCGALAGKLLFQQHLATLSSGSFLPGYDVVVCPNCGFGYADRIPAQAEFDAHYRDMSKYEHQECGGKECEFDAVRFRKMVGIVQQVAKSPRSRILDIGCSTGLLLSLLRETGYQNVRGLDPSPACAEAASRLYGIKVLTGALTDFTAPDGSFDVLILSGVLEHICDLQSVLAKLHRALADEGLLLISVPDAGRFASEEDAPFQQFSTEHINFFSAASLANLLHVHGFATVLSQANSYNEGLGYTYGGAVVDAVFRKSRGPLPWQPDTQTEPALADYIRRSQAVDDGIRQTIERILAAGESVIVWGVGTHTLRLLATSRLAEARIAAFVDANPRYQGKSLRDVPIISPAELSGRAEPILVSSRVFQNDIVRQIRETLALTNPLYLLYSL